MGRLLKVVRGDLKIAIELGLKCGLREQEIMHLEWADINCEEGTLRSLLK